MGMAAYLFKLLRHDEHSEPQQRAAAVTIEVSGTERANLLITVTDTCDNSA